MSARQPRGGIPAGQPPAGGDSPSGRGPWPALFCRSLRESLLWSGCVALLAVLLAAPGAAVSGQEPDTASAADTVTVDPDTVRYQLQGLQIEATRPTITGGGASAVELQLDSLSAVPSPTLSEILRDMPLIRVRRNSRGQIQPSLRGMEERQIAVLMDGVPLTIGWDNRTDLSVVPLTAANRIDMVRGLSSVLAGPNALGGVVKVGITRGPFPDSLHQRFRLLSSVDQTGALSTSGEVRHLWGDEGDRLWLRYGGGYRRSDGAALAGGLPSVAEGSGGHLVNSDLEYANAFVAARFQSGAGREWLSLSSSFFSAERGVTPELHLLGGPAPEPRFWRIPEHWRSVTSLSGGTGWGETPFGEGDLEAAVGVDVQHLEIDSFGSLAYADSVAGETGNDRTFSLRLLGDHTLGAGMLRGAVTLAQTWHEQILPGQDAEEFQQRLWSLGVEAEQSLAPGGSGGGAFHNPKLTVGLSVDGSATPETGEKPSRPDIWGWGGRASAQVLVGGSTRLHGGVSRKVRFPALRELFSGALGKFEPNPDLGPLTLKVGEVGATLHLTDADLQATLFQQRLEGAIVRAVLPSGKFQRQNRGETRATGLELAANWRPGPLSVRADLTLQDVELLDDAGEETGEKAEYQPEVSGTVRLEAPLALGVRGRGELEYIGSQFGANPETGNFVELDPSANLEVGLSRRLRRARGVLPALHLSVVAENLTDEAIFDQLGLPRPGRTIRVQAELR